MTETNITLTLPTAQPKRKPKPANPQCEWTSIYNTKKHPAGTRCHRTTHRKYALADRSYHLCHMHAPQHLMYVFDRLAAIKKQPDLTNRNLINQIKQLKLD